LVMRVVTFKAPEKLIEEVEDLALRSGVTKSDIIRTAIKEYVRNSKRKKPKFRVKRVVLY